MSHRQFHLTTEWLIAAPLESVWKQLSTPERWPEWWPAVIAVEKLADGDANGVGMYRRMHWRTALPYTLTFNLRTTRIDRLRLIEGQSDGALVGLGRWQLERTAGGTYVRYDWMVDVTKTWMRLALPVLRPLFVWNHNKVMASGREGLCRRLYHGFRQPTLPSELLSRYSRLH